MWANVLPSPSHYGNGCFRNAACKNLSSAKAGRARSYGLSTCCKTLLQFSLALSLLVSLVSPVPLLPFFSGYRLVLLCLVSVCLHRFQPYCYSNLYKSGSNPNLAFGHECDKNRKKETQCKAWHRDNVIEFLPGDNFYQEEGKELDLVAHVDKAEPLHVTWFFLKCILN